MPEKREKSVSFETMVKVFMRTYNIPTRKDVDKLLKRMDQLENLIKVLAAFQSDATAAGKPVTRTRDPLVKPGMTASNMVLEVIEKHPQGINCAQIHDATSFNPKKIRNIIYRLTRAGKVRIKSRGVYVGV